MRHNVSLFLLGAVAAAVMLPASVVAAGSLFRLQGGAGNVANVDAEHQLLSAESDPLAYYHHDFKQFTGGGSCVVVVSLPSNRALIVKQLQLNIATSSAFDATHNVSVYANNSCASSGVMARWQPSERGTVVIPMDPGFPVHAGGRLSVFAVGSMTGSLAVTGYTVPGSALP